MKKRRVLLSLTLAAISFMALASCGGKKSSSTTESEKNTSVNSTSENISGNESKEESKPAEESKESTKSNEESNASTKPVEESGITSKQTEDTKPVEESSTNNENTTIKEETTTGNNENTTTTQNDVPTEVEDNKEYVTISFNTGVSGISMENQKVEKNSKFTPNTLSYDGYKFDGWYIDSEFKYLYNGTANTTLTLYAKFIKIHTVTYKYENGDIISSERVLDNESVVSVPTVDTIVGKTFVGWTLNNSDFNLESAITADIILVAKYETIEATSQVSVLNSAAYQEGLYAEFMQYESLTEYNAYVKAESGSYKKIDSQLIRKYKSGSDYYYRVDVVGLKAGKYSLKIVPVANDTELTSVAKEINNLTATAHDRSGFGFVNGTSSGAYNDDGTLKSNAIVLYITQNTKNTVSLDVVTNSKGSKTTGVGLQNILNLYQKGYDSRPLCIRLIGQITDFETLEGGDILIKGVSCGVTFEGIGKDATCDGWGVRLSTTSNVEIRNLGFMNCNSTEGDSCSVEKNNNHVWVHNCDFFYGGEGGDADQAKGDGALDTKTSTYVTHSYNHFWDTGKSNLQGMKSESTSNFITYHHNWYDHSDSRHPRVRTCTVHVYNNYFDGNSKYSVGATMGSSVFVENNYFRTTSTMKPMMMAGQGTDNDGTEKGTFSGEAGGFIKAYGNTFDGKTKFVPYSTTNSVEFDAYVATSKNETIISSITTKKGGNSYNNFDTSSSMYSYTVQSAEDAKNTVMQYAGRVQGGDFKWTFDDSTEDSNSSVITALKSALTSYKSSLVSVQGEGESQEGGDTPSDPVDEITVDDVIALIAALPDPTAVVEADRTKIMAAKAAFDSLSASDRELVTNSSKLTSCINNLPAQSSFTIDFVNSTFATGNNATIYNDNDIVITTTKVSKDSDGRGAKFDSSKSFTITNNSSTTKTFVITAIGGDNTKTVDADGQTVSLSKAGVTITLVIEAGKSKTVTSNNGGCYISSITVS